MKIVHLATFIPTKVIIMDAENYDGAYSDSTIEENDEIQFPPDIAEAEVSFGEGELNENDNVAMPMEADVPHGEDEQDPDNSEELEQNHNSMPNVVDNRVHPADPVLEQNEVLPPATDNVNEGIYEVPEHNETNERANQDSNDDIIAVDDELVEIKPNSRSEPTVKSAKRNREPDSESDDETDTRNLCPICMDNWTNAGDHRVVCLKCGHLFGLSCIVRWLDVACSAGQRRCPQCNETAKKKDIRKLFVHNLKVLDTSENEKLKKEIETLKEDKRLLKMDLAKVTLENQLHLEELKQFLNKIKTLETKLRDHSSHQSQPSSQTSRITRLCLEHSLEISSAGGCRVMTWNTSLHELYVSQSSANSLFPGFSMRKIDIRNNKPTLGQCVFLHTKAIRDFAVRPESNDILLSVSLDKTAKLLDLSNNTVTNKFVTSNSLWSCCWDRTNLNRFFVGSQNGTVTQYDSRQPNAPLQQLTFPGDLSPVTSLSSLPYCAGRVLPQGGLLVSKLVSCWAYAQDVSGNQYEGQQLPLQGPFTSLCFDETTNHILVSTRPNTSNPNIGHIVYQLEQQGTNISCNIVRMFSGGTAQMQLSRPCFAHALNDTFVSAYVESQNNLSVWSLTSGQHVASMKVYDPVKDICALPLDDKLWFSALSEKTLRFYSML